VKKPPSYVGRLVNLLPSFVPYTYIGENITKLGENYYQFGNNNTYMVIKINKLGRDNQIGSLDVRYRASDMILRLHSDASYLSEAKARSRGAGHFYLGEKPSNQPVRNNGALLTTSIIMRNVMSSAAEAECGALFNNTKEAVPLRTSLAEMGHPQPPTPVNVDNSTTVGFANTNMKQKKSKSMDMRFYWIQDRVKQRQFNIQWRPGATNLADYFTKHHSPSHHRRLRPTYLHVLNCLRSILSPARVC
jgi:hypothetical protein